MVNVEPRAFTQGLGLNQQAVQPELEFCVS